jgi:hypothetical protein
VTLLLKILSALYNAQLVKFDVFLFIEFKAHILRFCFQTRKISMERQTLALNLKSRYQTGKIGIKPQKIGIEPQKLGIEPEKLGIEPRKLGIGIGIEYRGFGIGIGIGIDPLGIGIGIEV